MRQTLKLKDPGFNVEFLENYTKTGKAKRKLAENRKKTEETLKNQQFPSDFADFSSKVERKTFKRDGKYMSFDVISTEEIKNLWAPQDPNNKYLRAKDTNNIFKIDVEDWDLAKHVVWHEPEPGVLATNKGVTFEKYVGIVGKRLYPFNPRDKRREHYHNC